METIIVTRHPALVDYLREQGVITGAVRVVSQATADDVRAKHVVGVLPLHLAAEAAQVTVVDIEAPPELRGVELSLEQLRQYARSISTYIVKRVV